jgi:hypothetical protein
MLGYLRTWTHFSRTPNSVAKKAFWATLDAIGVEAARQRYYANSYGLNAVEYHWTEEWLHARSLAHLEARKRGEVADDPKARLYEGEWDWVRTVVVLGMLWRFRRWVLKGLLFAFLLIAAGLIFVGEWWAATFGGPP